MNLIELKCKLYAALLKLKNPTDADVNLMYELSKDKDIQNILRKRR